MFKKLFRHRWLKWSLIGLICLIVFFIVYFYLFFFTDVWYYLPGNQRFQAAFSRLRLSCAYYPYQGMCKQSCGRKRHLYRQAIADYLNKENDNIAWNQVKKSILDEKESNCFRIELINSIYLSQEKKEPNKKKIDPPQFLADYLVSENGGEFNGSNFVSQEILDLYGQSVFSGALSEKFIQTIKDPQASCQAKYNAIENLGRYGNDEITRPLFQKLIEENKDPDHLWIAYAASQMLSSPKKKDRKFVKWCESIIWGDYNPYIKEKMVDVLNYYKNNNKEEKQYIVNIFKKIYFDKSQDKFVRDEAANLLHYALGKGSEKFYPNPDISDDEFDEHYNGFPKFPKYCRKNPE